jgi:hypothetical protein
MLLLPRRASATTSLSNCGMLRAVAAMHPVVNDSSTMNPDEVTVD